MEKNKPPVTKTSVPNSNVTTEQSEMQPKPQVDEKPEVLVVDDDPAMLRALSTLAAQYGKITGASSMHQALQILQSNVFDLILTDYELGDGNGLNVLKSVHSISPEIPVIMITGFGSKDLIIDTIKENVFGFIEKPFDPEEVEALIQRALRKKQKEDVLNKFATLGEAAGQLVHEIANPLTAISLRIELLQQLASTAGNKKLSDSADHLSKSTNRIREIVKWTKSGLKSKNTADKLATEIFQMREILDSLREACIAEAIAQQVQVVITQRSDVKVSGNKDQLLGVLVNLVKNGIEAVASYHEKWVMVDVERKSEKVQITITDSGPGIPKEIRKKLFTPLFTTKKEIGTGLGLVIVEKILRAHEGNIFLNEGNKNTQFIIQLPAVT